MCGVLGFITDKPAEDNYSLLGDLLYVSASRGTDATGVAIVGERVKVIKEDLASDKFIKKHYVGLKKDIAKSKVVLGHTRLATQGHQRDNNNNHPIVGDQYVMVHNGTCPSMDRLKDYKYKGTVDSEILLSYVEKKGITEGLKALKGSAAVAIVGADEPGVVYLWRHNNPLWLAFNQERKTLFFASTEDILREGLSDILNFFSSFQMREIVEDILYKVTSNPLKIEPLEEIEPVGWGYSNYRGRGRGRDNTRHGYNAWEGDEYYGDENFGGSANTPLNSDVPPDKANGNLTSLYRQILECVWDSKKKIYSTEKPLDSDNHTSTRYYFDGPSYDFEHWRRLEGGGHVSIDKKLMKFFDHGKKSHFLMTVTDAIKEGLIDLSK